MNSFGKKIKFSTFGESHGTALGCLLDGVPAGLKIDESYIQSELDRRKPGKSEFETARKEADKVEILSGVFEGLSTGTPIAMVIYNTNQMYFVQVMLILLTFTSMASETIVVADDHLQEKQQLELQLELLQS